MINEKELKIETGATLPRQMTSTPTSSRPMYHLFLRRETRLTAARHPRYIRTDYDRLCFLLAEGKETQDR